MLPLEEQLALISRGAVEIIREEELKSKLKKSIAEKKPLTIKAGFDPTAPDIHLGHTVLLRKLRHFQQCGHRVIFLIGDATALVGDPSGQSAIRKVLTQQEVDKNAETYVRQVSKVLDIADEKLFCREHNSRWFLGKGAGKNPFPAFTFEGFVGLAQRYTVARLIERDDFSKRLKENRPVSFLELFYPLMQGYDSVMLKSDVELGGTDQKFNMLVGRDLQPSYGQEPQVVMTMPILEGLDGVNKMSKSLGNYIGISETAKDMFGKVMSVSDELMYKYYELLTDEDFNRIRSDVQAGKLHPKDAKKNLAKLIAAQYHGVDAALKQEEQFERAFKDKGFPSDLPLEAVNLGEQDMTLISFLADGAKLAASRGEAKRKIQEGAVEVNGAKVADINLKLEAGKEYKVRVGKRFKRAVIKPV